MLLKKIEPLHLAFVKMNRLNETMVCAHEKELEDVRCEVNRRITEGNYTSFSTVENVVGYEDAGSFEDLT